MKEINYCNKCGIELTNENWYATDKKSGYKICKSCRKIEWQRKKQVFIYNAF